MKDTAAPAQTVVEVILLQPHEDAGVLHQPDAHLWLLPEQAQWLIDIGVARRA